MPSDFFEFSIPEYRLHDNVPTAVFARAIPTTSLARVYVQAVGVNPLTADHATFHRTFIAIRGNSNPSTGTVTDVHPPLRSSGASAWELTAGINGNNVEIRVTSQDLATVLWQIKITIFFLTPD